VFDDTPRTTCVTLLRTRVRYRRIRFGKRWKSIHVSVCVCVHRHDRILILSPDAVAYHPTICFTRFFFFFFCISITRTALLPTLVSHLLLYNNTFVFTFRIFSVSYTLCCVWSFRSSLSREMNITFTNSCWFTFDTVCIRRSPETRLWRKKKKHRLYYVYFFQYYFKSIPCKRIFPRHTRYFHFDRKIV